MSYIVADLANRSEWQFYFEKLPIEQQDVYCSANYYSIYEKNGDGKALCFIFKDNEDFALYPFLKNKINDLGYALDEDFHDIQGAYGYNGIVASNYSPEFISIFYNSFQSYCQRENIVAEFTRFHPLIENHSFSSQYLDVILNRRTVSLNLTKSMDDIYSRYSSANRRAISKARKSGIEIIIQSQSINIDSFLKLYTETMRRVNAQKYLFFNKAYFNNLAGMKNVVLFHAVYRGEIIASSLCFHSRFYFHYHLSASSKHYLHLRPNNLLFHEMINCAQQSCCHYIHLGGGNSDAADDSLFRFKSNFSKDHKNFYIGKKIHNKKIYDTLIKQWKDRFPEKTKLYKDYLLKYRETD